MTSACHAEDHGFESRTDRHFGSIAQSVEQRTENPCVTGSIPVGATIEKFFELFELLIYVAIRNGCFFVFLITLKNKNYMLQ